jgi:5-oxopent-3-ene-1,2,5-tricarboxylate decarboxylase/2-hydroxyhepta-2,4-diene-1,7-dioate isomerase
MITAKMKFLGFNEVESIDVDPINQTFVREDKTFHVNELQIDNPVTGTVYGSLLNFQGVMNQLKDQLTEKPYTSPPNAPILYIKPANTFNRNGAGIPIPENVAKLEIGASLGIVIGKKAVTVTEETALSYIAGYVIVNDVSIPHESLFRPAIQQKARDGFCPMGPWIVDQNHVDDPDNLAIRVYINNELVQENSTKNLIRSVPRLLVDVTEFMSLNPGDVLFVGVPEMAPLAEIGDKVRIEIEGLGSLENIIVEDISFIWRE